MKHMINWLDRTMDEYRRIIESASSTGNSIINIKRDRTRQNELYANKRILAYSDLFSILESEQNKILELWYLKKFSKIKVAEMLKISRATLYRKRSEIANILYKNQSLLYDYDWKSKHLQISPNQLPFNTWKNLHLPYW